MPSSRCWPPTRSPSVRRCPELLPNGHWLRCTLNHKSPPRPVYCKHRLLLDVLHWYKPHVRPRHCFADRLCVVPIALVGFNIPLHTLRRHWLYCVTKLRQPPRPVVRSAAGLHTDKTRRRGRKQLHQLRALHRLAQQNVAALVHAVHLKNILCQIYPNSRTVRPDAPSRFQWLLQHFHFGTSDAVPSRGVHATTLSFHRSLHGVVGRQAAHSRRRRFFSDAHSRRYRLIKF